MGGALIPAQTILALGQMKLNGAVAGVNGPTDSISLSIGASVYSAPGDNYFPDLTNGWRLSEFNVFGDYMQNLQEGTVLELTALEQETAGKEEAAQASREIAALSQARAGVGEKFSIFYTDPRYAPQNDELPNPDQYIKDVFEKSNEIVAQQNEAADEYHKWDRKADLYVTALTIIAVAFFLFGLAQALKDARLRLTFAFFGMVVIGFSLLITITTLLI